MSQAPVIRNTSQQDLLNELHIFIKESLKLSDSNNYLDLTKVALRLLKSLPAARPALFEFFSKVFEKAAETYILDIENDVKRGTGTTNEAAIAEIHTVLGGFINDNAAAWAPIVSTWSLDLLGEISTKFAGRGHSSTNLNDALQVWMNCVATKVLVDINTKCLSSLMHSDTETCINALLDTSIKHSPNFDWVVAHVGSCFPHTVITRVLSCGLKDFCQIKSYEQGSNSPKLRSVVGILGHLAGSHSSDIQSAILEIFLWSIEQQQQETDTSRLQKKATVPFILQLCFLSTTLFSCICSEMKHILSVSTIDKIYPFLDDWCKYFGSNEILEDLLLTLILSCSNGGTKIINLLLECALGEHVVYNIREKSMEILQNVLYRIDENVRGDKQFELLKSFSNEIDAIHQDLLSSKELRAKTAAQLVVFLGHSNPSLFICSVSFLFQNGVNLEHLSLLVRILSHELINKQILPYTDEGGYFSVVLKQVLSRNCSGGEMKQVWKNLLILLKWEQMASIKSHIISKAIQVNLASLTDIFGQQEENVHIIAEILTNLDISNSLEGMPVEVVLKLTQATVNYFFICCNETATSAKSKGFERINRLLKLFCIHSKAARVLALRELLERALFCKDNILFGAKGEANFDRDSEKLLLKQNKNLNKTIPLTKHSSVFNGGIIGTGKRTLLQSDALPADVIAANTSELIDAIKSCCSSNEETESKFSVVSLDSVTIVSLLLVHFVSPDVMYNGLPWPDEYSRDQNVKLTIERDLFIRRLFDKVPVLWDLLNFLAVHRPALCYCSVLIRALTATIIQQWKNIGEQSKDNATENYKSLLDTTIKVIDVMCLGQLLILPLSTNIGSVLSYLKCYEIEKILKKIWSDMTVKIPSPALFTCDANGVHWRDPTTTKPSWLFTESLKIIMQRNIKSLGHMYSQMFINIPTSADK